MFGRATIRLGIGPHSSVNLECRSEMRCTRLAANTGRKKSPSRHHRTTLLGHIFATKACIDNRKKTCWRFVFRTRHCFTHRRSIAQRGGCFQRHLFVSAFVMAALWNTAGHYIFVLWFLLPSFYLFSFPRLISAIADWMFTILPHMVWPYCEFKVQA